MVPQEGCGGHAVGCSELQSQCMNPADLAMSLRMEVSRDNQVAKVLSHHFRQTLSQHSSCHPEQSSTGWAPSGFSFWPASV